MFVIFYFNINNNSFNASKFISIFLQFTSNVSIVVIIFDTLYFFVLRSFDAPEDAYVSESARDL